jgi:hypothetical protein
VKSLGTLARQLSIELAGQDTLLRTLKNWLETVDPATYEQDLPWSPEVKAAYDEYKSRVYEHAPTRQAFEKLLRDTNRTTDPEVHLQRARLAIKWAEESVR